MSSGKASCSLITLSPSISGSFTSQVLSPSVSLGTELLDNELVKHNDSVLSVQPSLSSSLSALFPIPSESVSTDSLGLLGNGSSTSVTPSLSSSLSTRSQTQSPSKSRGIELLSRGSVPQFGS